MAFKDALSKIRQEKGLTQGELAKKLYVTRQAVSRWENGDTTPGIDMVKLLAITLDVSVARLLEMPEGPVCQNCGMPMANAEEHGTESDGSPSADYCTHCYRDGEFRREGDMDAVIEGCAPYLAQYGNMTLDEAVSFMGAMLPHLKRWRDEA